MARRWNCEKLAEAIRTVLTEGRGKRAVAEIFQPVYNRCVCLCVFREGRRGKGWNLGCMSQGHHVAVAVISAVVISAVVKRSMTSSRRYNSTVTPTVEYRSDEQHSLVELPAPHVDIIHCSSGYIPVRPLAGVLASCDPHTASTCCCSTYLAIMRRKLGLAGWGRDQAGVNHTGMAPGGRGVGALENASDDAVDEALVAKLLTLMEETGADFTNTFRWGRRDA